MANSPGFKIKLFADGAELEKIIELRKNPLIKGFTTNPTLMHKAKVRDYREFTFEVLKNIRGLPLSVEVFSDDFSEMEEQAQEIASWGDNIFVKIPVTNTRGEFSGPIIRRLSGRGVKVNVTALMTAKQVAEVSHCLSPHTQSFVSVFAGRIADTGRNPMPIMADAVAALKTRPQTELIWASPRELLNIFQAEQVRCHIITATSDLLAKLPLVGKALEEFSLETVRMFRDDALRAGFKIDTSEAKFSNPVRKVETGSRIDL